MLGFSWLVEWSDSRIVGLSRREFLKVGGLTAVAVGLRRGVWAAGPLQQDRIVRETAVTDGDGFAWVFDGNDGLVFPAYFPMAHAPTEHKVFMPLIRSN